MASEGRPGFATRGALPRLRGRGEQREKATLYP